uniref:G-protein coupled receptors family 1 profile domain-containing protein n=1 Tax=Anabas testudineus TaxID=64144 RepID=A0A3Q1HRZ5_ANATE
TSDGSKNLVWTAFHNLSSPSQASMYIILLTLAILGNTTVVGVIGNSVIREHGGAPNSDIIIFNMALSNLLVSLMRNTPLALSDWLQASKALCQFLMGVWMWLRSVNVWSTFFLSAFHLLTLRRMSPTSGTRTLGVPKTLLLSLSLIWLLNYICSFPAHIFSTNGGANATERLMLVSSTTRPVLHCVWNFPSLSSGLAFATTSIVIHEITPIVLMCFTSLCSLYTLYNHRRLTPFEQNATVIKHVPAEIRAAKVILALIMLFVTSWGTSVISVTYFNYNNSSSIDFLLVIARFSNIIFLSMLTY